MFGSLARKIALAMAAAVAFSGPLAAQTYSDGYLFLQAIEKKDVSKADELLGKPGSTLINSRDLTTGRTGLHIAADRRDVVWLVYLLNRGANPNIADNRGVTPLMRASQLGFYEGLEHLVTAGARVDAANSTGETPLILAVHRRDLAMVRVLLKAGADPDRTDNAGRSARDYAETLGRDNLIRAELARADSGGQQADNAVYGPSF
ncbi:MAG TPA: ankyrin repeat domain-containing protein [Croceibacterium sp.]|nr:ankyrin repeat domain-containing protein [Croceibacterium sp.]